MLEYMIKNKHIFKQYRLGQIGGTTLRDELQRYHAKLRGKEDTTKRISVREFKADETIQALDDESFDIMKGKMMASLPATDKHAYLILFHKNSSQLIRLLQTLDDDRNDIYIHADKRTKEFPTDKIQSAVKKSRLFFTKRISVTWGGFSLVRATLILLQEATNNRKYAYYHLLSGQDLPIKTQDYIHDFFREKQNMEFIKVKSTLSAKKQRELAYYRFFQEYARKDNRLPNKVMRYAEKFSLLIQRRIRINRLRGQEERIYSGSEWFSITHEFALYLLQREKWIKKQFRWTFCSDEVFVQTIVMNSPFRSSVHPAMRRVEWRGADVHPWVYQMEDYNIIFNSDCLFARKFDETVDAEIIDRVIRELCCLKQ